MGIRLAHLADLHLGFSQFYRTTPNGQNQRAADVMLSFSRAVDAVAELRPDVICVAGDVFHTAAPHYAIASAAMRGFRRLAAVAPVVAVEGNHDRSGLFHRGAAIDLLRQCGVFLATQKPERFVVGGVSILAVPEGAASTALYEPDGAHPCNVLLLHAAVMGAQQSYGTLEPEALNSEKFRYVALGDFHTHRRVTVNAWYAGALDYTSTDPWRESRSEIPKGFVIHDLDTGAHEFHEIPGVRVHLDLPKVDARGMSPSEIDAAIQASVGDNDVAGKVVRLVLTNVQRGMLSSLDHKALRKLQGAALHFNLDLRVWDVKAAPPVARAWSYIDPSYSYLQDDDGMGPRDDESFRELSADAGEVCGADAPYCETDASRVPLGNDLYELEEVK